MSMKKLLANLGNMILAAKAVILSLFNTVELHSIFLPVSLSSSVQARINHYRRHF